MLSMGSRILPWLLKTYPYPFLIFLSFIGIFGVASWIDYFLYEDAVKGTIHRNKSIASFTARYIVASLEGEIARIQAYASSGLVINAARNKDAKGKHDLGGRC